MADIHVFESFICIVSNRPESCMCLQIRMSQDSQKLRDINEGENNSRLKPSRLTEIYFLWDKDVNNPLVYV